MLAATVVVTAPVWAMKKEENTAKNFKDTALYKDLESIDWVKIFENTDWFSFTEFSERIDLEIKKLHPEIENVKNSGIPDPAFLYKLRKFDELR
jgi:hypothetical protein